MNLKTILTGSILTALIGFAAVNQGFSQNGPGQGQQPPSFKSMLKEFDTNKDGKLAKTEVKGPLLQDFAKIDADKDGFITKEELEAAPKPNGRPPKRN